MPTPKANSAGTILATTGNWLMSNMARERSMQIRPVIGSLLRSASEKTTFSDIIESTKPANIKPKNSVVLTVDTTKPAAIVTMARSRKRGKPWRRKKRSVE